MNTLPKKTKVDIAIQSLHGQLDTAKGSLEEGGGLRFSKKRAQRLYTDSLNLLTAIQIALPGGKVTVEALSILQATFLKLTEIIAWLRQATVFEYFLRKGDIESTFDSLHTNLRLARNQASLRVDETDKERKQIAREKADDADLWLRMMDRATHKKELALEIAALQNQEDVTAILSAFQELRRRERSLAVGFGIQAQFIRNACSALSGSLGLSTPITPSASSPLLSPYLAPAPRSPIPIAGPSQPQTRTPPLRKQTEGRSAPVTGAAPTWLNPQRSAGDFLLGGSFFAGSPEASIAPLLPPDKYDNLMRDAAAARAAANASRAKPRREYSGVRTNLIWRDLQTGAMRTHVPFAHWLFEEPIHLSRGTAVDLQQFSSGDTMRVITEWRSRDTILDRALSARKVLPNKIDTLHPPINSTVYILGVFQIRLDIFAVCTPTRSNGELPVGLLPVNCLSVSGRKPSSTPGLLTFPIHHCSISFSAKYRSGGQTRKVEGILNVLAIEILSNEGWISTPFQSMRKANQYEEKLDVDTPMGRAQIVFYVLSVQLQHGRMELLFDSEMERANLLMDLLRLWPGFPLMDNLPMR